MKKKIFSKLIMFVLIAIGASCLTACTNNSNKVVEKIYTVNFYNEDGTLLSSNEYKKGETVLVPNSPTKLNDEQYTYQFKSWDKEVAQQVNGSVNYYATYIKESNFFDLEILNYKECLIKPKTGITILPETVRIPEALYDVETQKYYNVISMGEEIFDYSLNTNVKNIYIPNTIKTLNSSYNSYSYVLSNFYYDGTVRDWFSVNIALPQNPFNEAEHFYFISETTGEYEELKNLVIPEGVISIGQYQFEGFDCIESITFEGEVPLNFIGHKAFSECDNIKKIYCKDSYFWSYWDETKALSVPFENVDNFYIYNAETLKYDEIVNYELNLLQNVNSEQYSGCHFIDTVKVGLSSDLIIIESSTFSNMGELSLLHIGKGVVEIKYGAFYGTSVDTTIIDSEYIVNSDSWGLPTTNVVYVKSDIFDGVINGYTKETTSDKEGYTKYIKT